MVNLGSVWDRAIDFLKDARANVLPIAAGGVFVPLAVMGVLMPLAGDGLVDGWGIGLLLVALGAATLCGNLAVTALAIDPTRTWRAAALVALDRLPIALLVSVAGFAVATVAILPIYAAFAMGGGTAASGPSFGAGLFVVLYTLLLAVAGILVIARLLLFNAVLVAERIGIAAVLRSYRLTARMTVKMAGLVMFYLIMSQIAGFVTRTACDALFAATGNGDAFGAIVVALVQTVFSVFAAAFVARLFLAVRDVREAVVELS